MNWLEQALIKKLRASRLAGLRDQLKIAGRVEVILRYSDLHHNSKLRGEVYQYHDLGHNLVVIEGRRIAAGLMVGDAGVGAGLGYNETKGYVVRGMGLGTDPTPESDTDSAALPVGGLYAPSPGALAWDHYYPLTSTTFLTGAPPGSGTEVVFTRLFDVNEPDVVPVAVREFGLYSATPAGVCPNVMAGSVPPGPALGPFLIARKTHATITKDPTFTMTVNWTLEY